MGCLLWDLEVLNPSSGGTKLRDKLVSVSELSFSFLQKKHNFLLKDYLGLESK